MRNKFLEFYFRNYFWVWSYLDAKQAHDDFFYQTNKTKKKEE